MKARTIGMTQKASLVNKSTINEVEDSLSAK